MNLGKLRLRNGTQREVWTKGLFQKSRACRKQWTPGNDTRGELKNRQMLFIVQIFGWKIQKNNKS